MKKQTIVTLDQDGPDVRAMAIPFEILAEDPEYDLVRQIKRAAAHFLSTDEGYAAYEYNNEAFNWGDLVSEVPEEICIRYGFRILPGSETGCEVRDFNEQLDEIFLSRPDNEAEDGEVGQA